MYGNRLRRAKCIAEPPGFAPTMPEAEVAEKDDAEKTAEPADGR